MQLMDGESVKVAGSLGSPLTMSQDGFSVGLGWSQRTLPHCPQPGQANIRRLPSARRQSPGSASNLNSSRNTALTPVRLLSTFITFPFFALVQLCLPTAQAVARSFRIHGSAGFQFQRTKTNAPGRDQGSGPNDVYLSGPSLAWTSFFTTGRRAPYRVTHSAVRPCSAARLGQPLTTCRNRYASTRCI